MTKRFQIRTYIQALRLRWLVKNISTSLDILVNESYLLQSLKNQFWSVNPVLCLKNQGVPKSLSLSELEVEI